MPSIPFTNDSTRAQESNSLRSKVSEQSEELSVRTDDNKQALFTLTAKKSWKPWTHKAYFLVPTILASGALIAILQIYLERSNRDTGILFASRIIDLPLDQKFPYLYLPTIVSLLLSFAWAWLDLDVRRLQPFLELSKERGARGTDSLLLHYPFDFVALVLFAAAKRRHWPVFSASLAVVIIHWGLTPLQSSMFATRTIEKTIPIVMARSTSYLSSREQESSLTAEYAQSVYNIAWLNETLPPFMSPQGLLAPFGLLGTVGKIESSETWTASTRFYSVDLQCERDNGSLSSSNGCHYSAQNMALPPKIKDDEYYSLYVGYWYEESMDSYLLGSCPDDANQTLLVRWSRGQQRQANLALNEIATVPKEEATLWCTSSYYQQDVEATVSVPAMGVLEIVPTGPKTALPMDFFNVTDFEWGLSQGSDKNANRGTYPDVGIGGGWPSPYDRLCHEFPKLVWDPQSAYLSNMATFALGTYQRPMAEYLDAEVLKDSYQAAYRLLFARRLSNVLHPALNISTTVLGSRRYSTQTIIMVPAFVYVVETMIAFTATAAFVVFLLSLFTRNKLSFEPASIASLMALSSGDCRLIEKMSGDDCTTTEDLSTMYNDAQFGLTISRLNQGPTICFTKSDDRSSSTLFRQPSKPKLTLPMELSWTFGFWFMSLQAGLSCALVYVYVRIQTNNGLPLPSKSLFVNQLLKNYLPMVVGASFEPIFTMITSTLCMLQPYEQLRRGHEKPGRSITLNYASLPPQAVVFRALKNKHIGLAFVSLMTILANVLSVAFSGLLTESSVLISQNTDFMATHQFPLNGTSIGNESLSRNRPSYDSYYVASSNLTADTPLPPWTDGQYFYLPFEPYVPSAANITQRKAATPAVKASLHCFPMRQVTNGRDLTLKTPDGRITCDLGLWASFTSAHNNTPQAIEHVSFASSDQSEQGPEYCDLKVMAGWTRASKAPDSGPLNASWVGCMPALQVDVREVTVDLKGNVLFSTPLNSTTGIPEHVFEPDDMGVVNSVHKVLDATSLVGLSHITNPSWHNDSYPSNFINYLMAQTTNSTAFLDPVLSPPPFEEVAPLLDLLYSKLFAITLANNIDKILCPSSDTTTLTGVSMGPETRIFAQEEMLFVAVVILAVFFLVTLVLYIRRPWRILPRMPTTLASQIAFFAASHALVDLAETSGMSEKERNSYVKGLEQTYGFGRFVGTDGKPHIGIEREPLVQILTKQDLRAMRKDAVID